MNSRFSIRSSRRVLTGFSLVEVAVAMGVLAIGLLAIIGLFPHGLQAGRDAADNTIAATIVQDLFSQLRSGPFNNVLQICTNPLLPSDPNYPGCVPGFLVPLNLTAAGTQTLTFDQDGFITSKAAYYRVDLAWQPQPLPNWPSPLLPYAPLLVTATISYPALTPNKTINSYVYVTEIAWYDNPL